MADPKLPTSRDDVLRPKQPEDFTIIVSDSEFKVHKAVLVSASHYFSAMMTNGMLESQTNKVKLHGLNSEDVKKLVEFAYTGDEGVVSDNPKQLLECASYLQMPAAVEACTKKLVDRLTPTNCMAVHSVFVSLSLESAVQTVNNYIKSYMKIIKEQCPVRSVSLEGLQVILENWNESEMRAFRYVEAWIGRDESRRDHVNDLMSHVRFGIMTRMEISIVKRNKLYKLSKQPWCELVDGAQEYQKLPVHLRMKDKTLQTTVRGEPSEVMLTTSKVFYVINKKGHGIAHLLKATKMPRFRSDQSMRGVVVNNYFIMYANFDWYAFDPRSKTLSQMGIQGMELMSDQDFITFHHDGCLYAIGGRMLGEGERGCRLQRYSFTTDSWTLMPNLPVYVEEHAACIMGDRLYVCGGYIEDVNLEDQEDDGPRGDPVVRSRRFYKQRYFFASSRLYSIDFLAESPKWKRHRSCPTVLKNHTMAVVDEVLAVSNCDDIQLYDPVCDQWTLAEKGYKYPEDEFYDVPFPLDALCDKVVPLALPPSTTETREPYYDYSKYNPYPNLPVCWITR